MVHSNKTEGKMMKKILNQISIMVVASILSLASVPNSTFAETSKSDINRIKEKRSDVQEQAEKAKDEISKLTKQQNSILTSLDMLDTSIKSAQKETAHKEEEISKGKKEIDNLKEELKELELRTEQRQDIINDRLRSLQKSGGNNNYLDVILGSSSFNDLIQRINAVSTFMNADQDIMAEQKKDHELVEKKENKLSETQKILEKDKVRLLKISSDLAKQENEMKKLLVQLKDQVQEKKQDVLSLQEQEELLTQQEKAIRAARNVTKNNSTGSNSGQLPTVSSGNFTRPADGYLSSGFGYRSFDNEMHWGVDIVKKGNVPIVSAADGVVIRAYQSSSYGNVVYITHNIDGKTFTSVYAHMKSFQVSSGQTVSKGQQIGVMGNTGQSFGQHLHFELHAGQWNQSKSNAVNPAKYINL